MSLSRLRKTLRKYHPQISTALFTACAAMSTAAFGWLTLLPWILLVSNVWIQKRREETVEVLHNLTIQCAQAEAQWLISFPPGEIADKLSILGLKKRKIGLSDDLNLQWTATEATLTRAITICLGEDVWKQKKLDVLLGTLAEINEEQWNWEDKVRIEGSPIAALGARECNTRRVKVKNEINRLCSMWGERKQYASKD
jgi:hypothetical protein